MGQSNIVDRQKTAGKFGADPPTLCYGGQAHLCFASTGKPVKRDAV